MMANKRKPEKTLDCQAFLPALPVPKLEDTCQRYLESIKPLVSDEQYLQTVQAVELFERGDGKQLHEKLIQRSAVSKNWLQSWWFDAYLKARGPAGVGIVCGGGSPISGIILDGSMRFRTAALYTYHLLCSYEQLIRQMRPIEKLKDMRPCDMIQYYNTFCGGRIPGKDKDIISKYIHCLPRPDGGMQVIACVRHIIALMHGRVFMINVFDEENKLIRPPELQWALEAAAEICAKLGDGPSVCSLTAATRPVYKQAYDRLGVLDRQNIDNIDLINAAILSLSFSDCEAVTQQESCLDGLTGSCQNRWYDKSLQLVISKVGLIGTCYDHSHVDGLVVNYMLEEARVACAAANLEWTGSNEIRSIAKPLELPFVIDDTIKSVITEAQYKHDQIVTLQDARDAPLEGFGKVFAKSLNVKPDTMIQLAIQLAYYSMYNRCASTYESATTRPFYHGRTETVRSCTSEAKAWTQSMCDANFEKATRKRLFYEACKKHDRLMEEACAGKGIDRHLLGLKLIAEEEGMELPTLYRDAAWRLSGGDNNFTLSTSFSGFVLCHGCVSAMTEDGYGAFYTMQDERTYLVVTSWKTSKVTDCHAFHDKIRESLQKIAELCLEAKL